MVYCIGCVGRHVIARPLYLQRVLIIFLLPSVGDTLFLQTLEHQCFVLEVLPFFLNLLLFVCPKFLKDLHIHMGDISLEHLFHPSMSLYTLTSRKDNNRENLSRGAQYHILG
jgi:hypothetical protein